MELAYADEEIDATAAEANVAQLLGVHKRAPVLRIRQVIYSTKSKATMYGVGYYRLRAPYVVHPALPIGAAFPVRSVLIVDDSPAIRKTSLRTNERARAPRQSAARPKAAGMLSSAIVSRPA